MHNTIQRYSRLGGIALLGIIAMAALVAAYGVNTIRIGGGLYQKINLNGEILNDISPPSFFIVEPYVEARLMAKDLGNFSEHSANLQALEKNWRERTRFFEQSDLPDDDKANMAELNRATIAPFWEIVDQVLRPAARRGDAAAADAALVKLDDLFDQNRTKVQSLVTASEQDKGTFEDDAGSALMWTTILLTIAILAIAGGVASAIVLLRRHVFAPLGDTADIMGRMADGDLEAGRRSVHAETEIGTMTRTTALPTMPPCPAT